MGVRFFIMHYVQKQVSRAEREGYTYEKRYGWLRPEEANGCKYCNDSESHKYPEWMTKKCKPLVMPDKWDDIDFYKMNMKRLPDDISEEDLIYWGSLEWMDISRKEANGR